MLCAFSVVVSVSFSVLSKALSAAGLYALIVIVIGLVISCYLVWAFGLVRYSFRSVPIDMR